MKIAILAALLSLAESAAAGLAVTAETIYTMSGQPIEQGVILIEDGKISAVGRATSINIPHDYDRLAGVIVTPGLIDARSVVGLSGAFNVSADQDQDEITGPNQAKLRAIDAYNPTELLVEWVNRFGVTTLQTGPGRANVIAGQTAIVKTRGGTLAEVLVKAPAAMIFNLGEIPKQTYGEERQEPGTRMATAAIIRGALADAANYRQQLAAEKKDKPVDRDLTKESLLPVLDGEIPAIIMAHRADDISTAIRIAKEFDLRLIIDSATEAYLIRDTLLEAKVPILVHPTLQRNDRHETLNTSLENAALLHAAGIPIAIQSGTESYVPKTRVLLLEAAIAHAAGLPFEATLEAITIGPAQMLGIDNRVGSIATGKDADLVLFDANPFEYMSHVTTVLVDGEVTYQR
ncbi:MAG: amidohydrolase family protein [Gammaproteobacteria bacterium]|nr:amidohydrolase family protein [Gammaproteobacteria bacterium]